MPTLFILAGLPGAGKPTLARRLAQHFGAMHLEIDTIEQGLRELCNLHIEGEGYRLAYRIAADNLQIGLDVIADSCNPIEITRQEWEHVATINGAAFVNIEVTCTDVQNIATGSNLERPTLTDCGFQLGRLCWIGNTTTGLGTESSLTPRRTPWTNAWQF